MSREIVKGVKSVFSRALGRERERQGLSVYGLTQRINAKLKGVDMMSPITTKTVEQTGRFNSDSLFLYLFGLDLTLQILDKDGNVIFTSSEAEVAEPAAEEAAETAEKQ